MTAALFLFAKCQFGRGIFVKKGVVRSRYRGKFTEFQESLKDLQSVIGQVFSLLREDHVSMKSACRSARYLQSLVSPLIVCPLGLRVLPQFL